MNGSAILTLCRAPMLPASLGPSTSPPQGRMDPCIWWTSALSGTLGFSLVSRMNNAALMNK